MKMTPYRLFCFSAPLLMGGMLTQCSTSGTIEESEQFPEPYRTPRPTSAPIIQKSDSGSLGIIQSGDRLELFLDEDPTFNGLYVVRAEGHILIPKVGRIPVAGKSRIEAEQLIRQRFEATQVRSATLYVELITDRKFSESLSNHSGQLFPPPGTSTDFSPDSFSMTGRVNRPGNYTIPQKYLTRFGIYEAILLHGGIANFGDPTKIELMRYDENGQLTRRMVNLKKIKAGKEENHLIGDGDIIHVPEKVFGF